MDIMNALRSLWCCLNPKVIAVLAVVGVVAWLAFPGGGAAVPVLVALVCPLSMGAMAWRMRTSANGCAAPKPPDNLDLQLRAARDELAALTAEAPTTSREQIRS